MSTHIIPKTNPSIHNPIQKPTILYALAKHHTNEEIFIGLAALEERYNEVHCIDDVFNEIRNSIRSVARLEGRTDDETANELLKAQSKNRVILRNREQIREDRFGRKGRQEASANEQRVIACRVLEEHRGFVATRAVAQQAAHEI